MFSLTSNVLLIVHKSTSVATDEVAGHDILNQSRNAERWAMLGFRDDPMTVGQICDILVVGDTGGLSRAQHTT